MDLHVGLWRFHFRYWFKLIGDAFGEAIDCNQRVLDKKARILQCVIWSLVAEVVALAVLAFVSLW